MEITKQRIESRPINIVEVCLSIESGCDPKEGEYSMDITGFTGTLDIGSIGGVDDISLIKEAIQDHHIDFPEAGVVNIVLEESGEWEDVFWNKYYEVKRVCIIEL